VGCYRNEITKNSISHQKPELFFTTHTQLTKGYKMRKVPIQKRSSIWECFLISKSSVFISVRVNLRIYPLVSHIERSDTVWSFSVCVGKGKHTENSNYRTWKCQELIEWMWCWWFTFIDNRKNTQQKWEEKRKTNNHCQYSALTRRRKRRQKRREWIIHESVRRTENKW
jgi:hypothetical protein